jgi:hypothetical protein
MIDIDTYPVIFLEWRQQKSQFKSRSQAPQSQISNLKLSTSELENKLETKKIAINLQLLFSVYSELNVKWISC